MGRHHTDAELAKGVALHQKGIDGDKKAVEAAYQLFKQLKTKKSTPLIEAYYGSSMALLARDHPDVMDKTNYAKRGMKALDAAVRQEPDNHEIRLLRGNVAFRLPEALFKRTKTATSDFLYLVEQHEQSNTLGKKQYEEVLYKLGKAYKTLGDDENAEAVWSKLIKLNKTYKSLVAEGKKS